MVDPIPFATPADWDAWLRANHATTSEVWLRLYKKDSGTPSITWEQGVIGALCWGWIDGQAKPLDTISWLQRFTPRRAKSGWSTRNRDHVARLIAEGRMQPPGLAQVQAAQADGRWDAAYSGPKDAEVPADFLAALKDHPDAQAFYATLNSTNRHAIYYRLHSAKRPETRAKRLALFVAMMQRGERLV